MKNVNRTVLVGLIAVPFAYAQQKAVPEDDIFELSPFTVDASQDEGYRATNTLAGTRLRTELKDLGTSIQVITKDFMNDIGAQDAQDLLLYTTNTEVGGIAGNYSGEDATGTELNSATSRSNPQSANRVRGLFQADLTRGYFRTNMPFDTYNTSTVSINRGSNATLFGVGSPAGIIDNTPDAASWKDSGEIALRFDNEGSIRGSVNFNKVLLDDKLSFRGALLQDDRQYYQENAFQDSKRSYAALNWKISQNTALRANYESGTIRANRPDSLSPLESLSPWLAYGKPVLDLSLGTGIGRSLTAPTGIKVDKNGDGILDDVYPSEINASNIASYTQYADGSFTGAGKFTWDAKTKLVNAPAQPTLPGATKLQTGGFVNSGVFNQIALPYNSGSSLPALAGFIAEIPANIQVPGDAFSLMGDGQDPFGQWKGVPNYAEFFDFYKTQGYTGLNQGHNWGQVLLEGSTASQSDKFDAVNIALEQTFWDRNAGIEIAYDSQSFDRDSYIPLQFRNGSDIQVDVNARLPDGRENPNFGRPYALARGGRSYTQNELKTYRATGFIQHDFAKQHGDGWARWLGRHTVTGLYDRNEQIINSYGSSMVWGDDGLRALLGTTTDATHFNNQVNQIVYLGSSLLGPEVKALADVKLEAPQGLDLWAPNTMVPVTYWDPGINAATGLPNTNTAAIIANGRLVTKDALMIEGYGAGATYSDTITDSQAAVWQGYFLQNHLVSTIGYRKDSVDNQVYKAPPRDSQFNSNPFAPHSEWGGLDMAETSDSRWSYGAVLHIPSQWTQWKGTQVSTHFAQSSNFTLQPGRVTWDDAAIPDPTGDTEEMGFSVATMEGKLNVKLNWFETSLQGQSGPYGSPQWNLIYQGSSSYARAAQNTEDPVFKAFNLAVANQLLSFVTPGMEVTNGVTPVYDASGTLVDVKYSAIKNIKDTQDVVSKGFEVELTYNPTKNWRMHLNVGKQQSIKSNVQPYSSEQLPLLQSQMATPIPGFEWLTAGEVARNLGTPANWVINPATKEYHPLNNSNFTNQADFLEGKLVVFRTAKAAEGAASPEQREWRANFVTNYSFSEGKLKGLQVGGSYRWQSELGVGYPLIVDPATGLTIGDIANPVFAPEEDSVDLYTNYALPWLREHGRWSVRLQVSNAFASEDDVIPVSVQPDGVSWARVRLAPQRLWTFSSTFRF